jgi:hypothetical protein
MYGLDEEIKIEKELAKIVLGALTGPEELKEYSSVLMEKYGVTVEPEPTLIEIARETQALAIGLDTISEELRDQRLKAILKKIALVVPEAVSGDDCEVESTDSESIASRFDSLGE